MLINNNRMISQAIQKIIVTLSVVFTNRMCAFYQLVYVELIGQSPLNVNVKNGIVSSHKPCWLCNSKRDRFRLTLCAQTSLGVTASMTHPDAYFSAG